MFFFLLGKGSAATAACDDQRVLTLRKHFQFFELLKILHGTIFSFLLRLSEASGKIDMNLKIYIEIFEAMHIQG